MMQSIQVPNSCDLHCIYLKVVASEFYTVALDAGQSKATLAFSQAPTEKCPCDTLMSCMLCLVQSSISFKFWSSDMGTRLKLVLSRRKN